MKMKTKKQIVIFLMLMLTACGGGGDEQGGDPSPGTNNRLEGNWDITMIENQNTCPGPAFNGFFDDDWTIVVNGSNMTLQVGDSQFIFEGAVSSSDENFSFVGDYSYPDQIDPTCIYDATLTVDGSFIDEDTISGAALLSVIWSGTCLTPGQCQRGGNYQVIRMTL